MVVLLPEWSFGIAMYVKRGWPNPDFDQQKNPVSAIETRLNPRYHSNSFHTE
jgi:hypothetical protein